ASAGNSNPNNGAAKGSGARGSSQWGRDRTANMVGTTALGNNALRPRHAIIAKNSILTFQKVSGYTIDASGAPVVSWTTPVVYQVINRQLVRIQDGLTSVIC